MRITSRLIKQEARRQAHCPALRPDHSPPTACRHAVSGSISLPSQGFFSPFPHGTGALSVASEYLALEGGPPGFPRDSSCPVVLRNPLRVRQAFGYAAVTLYGPAFQLVRLASGLVTLLGAGPTTPRSAGPRFGLFRFRSPLLPESRLISFPPGTEMVHFPGFARTRLWIQRAVSGVPTGRVSPFGDPRINACLRLPEAYRSLPRPSSPAGARASTARP